jgi:NADH dehydrogenase FAD-containing subunit/class 3 adenylate cyclase/uncharacterized membrane protein YphA (DoxX/SURF4 family)
MILLIKDRDMSIPELMKCRFRKILLSTLSFIGLCLFSDLIFAHERWILTPEQIIHWNSLQSPILFSQWSTLNLTMISIFSTFIIGWVWLGFTGARELFPDLQARLSSYGDHVPRILRVCVGWILLSSALGAEPRFGVEAFTVPTFFAPDLDIAQLGANWAWLRWAEVVLGLTILLGIYVRLFAGLLILLSFLGAYLYGEALLAYVGAMLGACIYLVLQGPGRHYLPLPTPALFQGLQAWLAEQPRQRAQAIMRILTGTTLLYLGVFFKVMQPNLSIGIITYYQLPILSINPEAFTLLMALVEVSAGILMIAGVLLRPLSLFLIFTFSIFAFLLPETITEHILFYGVLLSCLINSAGHFRRPIARDKAAHILIVGGGLSALQAAIKIERLIGQYSNVKITLLHDQANFLFAPFLPEVIGGTVQPGNVVNPFRRIIQQTTVLVGHLDSIDEQKQIVIAKRKNNELIQLHYDSLIIALSPKSNIASIPGMAAHACLIDSVADALRIRQRVLDLVEEAEFEEDSSEQVRLLSFAVLGFGESASAIAVEISQILRAAESSYTVLQRVDWQVHLFNEQGLLSSDFENKMSVRRAKSLKKAGVIEHLHENITSITQRDVFFADGQSQPVGLVINASLQLPTLPFKHAGELHGVFAINDQLRLLAGNNIWVTETEKSLDHSQFVFTRDRVNLGYSAGFNAWAHSQGYASRTYKQKSYVIKPCTLGQYSVCSLGGLVISGKPAWFFSRLTNLLSVPGLERNLRIIIDWFLVLAFRNDIAVLSQATSSNLQMLHFKAGDAIFAQGDAAEMAYAVDSGQLKVMQDGRKIKDLGPGDYFGEIMPIHEGKRFETIRCVTDCELKLISQEDLNALLKSGWLMGKAIRNLSTHKAEYEELGTSLGIKRLTYVSKLNTVMTLEEILEIGRISTENNKKIDVTGVLISVRDYFFQVLEGDAAIVDVLVEKISRDPRHHEVTILSAETECEERLFTEWGMKTVALSESNDLMLLAIGMMLQNIAQSYNAVGRYTQPALLKYLMEGIDPLTIPVKNTEKIVVSGSMTDLSGLYQQFLTKDLIEVINVYLEICSTSFIEYGGQVAKYNDACIIAHFAPDDVDAAIAACLDAHTKFKVFVSNNSLYSRVMCGFGIASGIMIEGNIGSSVKMDYTVFGEVVNQAVTLGALARDKDRSLAISEAIKDKAADSWYFDTATKSDIAGDEASAQVYLLANE